MPSGHDCKQTGRLPPGQLQLPGLQSAIPPKALPPVADQLLPPHLKAQRQRLQVCSCLMHGVVNCVPKLVDSEKLANLAANSGKFEG